MWLVNAGYNPLLKNVNVRQQPINYCLEQKSVSSVTRPFLFAKGQGNAKIEHLAA